MNKEQEAKKQALFFNLACQDGDINSLLSIYSKCEQIEKSYLESFFPVHSAVRAESCKVVEFLAQNQFNLNSKNNSGITPLFIAVSMGSADIVKLLIKFGVDVDLSDSRGWTPLMVAVKNNNATIARVLVQEGKANPKAKDRYGKTAFDKASSIEILNALRCLNEEEEMLKTYAKNSEDGSKTKDDRKNEMFFLRDLLNQELDTMTQEDCEGIKGKMKEKFILHSRNLGLDVTEKAFTKILDDLDKKLEGYCPILFEEANKNLNNKYKKFVQNIEKYLNLKLNIILTATLKQNFSRFSTQSHLNQSFSSMILNSEIGSHLPSMEDISIGFQSPTYHDREDYLKSFRSPHLTSDHEKENFEKSILNEYMTKNNNISPSKVRQNTSDFEAFNNMRTPKSVKQSTTKRNTPLCRRSTTKPEISSFIETSRSPSRQRFRSEEHVLKKKDDNQKLYQLLINQTDKMVEIITKNAEVALDKIFDHKLAVLRDVINDGLHKKFKDAIGEVREMIEEKIVSTVQEQIYESRKRSAPESKPKKNKIENVKKTEESTKNDKTTLPTYQTTSEDVEINRAKYKPLSEKKNRGELSSGHKRPPNEYLVQRVSQNDESNESSLSQSFKKQREEFIKKKIEKQLTEQSLSPQKPPVFLPENQLYLPISPNYISKSNYEGSEEAEYKPKKLEFSNKTSLKETKTNILKNCSNRIKKDLATSNLKTQSESETKNPRTKVNQKKVRNSENENEIGSCQENLENLGPSPTIPVGKNSTLPQISEERTYREGDLKESDQNLQFDKQTKNGVAFSLTLSNQPKSISPIPFVDIPKKENRSHQPFRYIPIIEKATTGSMKKDLPLNQDIALESSRLMESDSLYLISGATDREIETLNQYSEKEELRNGENDQEKSSLQEKENQMNFLLATLNKASFFDTPSNRTSARNSVPLKGLQ